MAPAERAMCRVSLAEVGVCIEYAVGAAMSIDAEKTKGQTHF